MWTRQDLTSELKTHSIGEIVDHFLGLQICVQRMIAGDTYECVFCAGRFARFLPFGADNDTIRRHKIVGAGPREHALCPLCFSLDRERLVYLYLRDCTELLTRSPRVLHVAPERCLEKVLRRSTRLYVSADLAEGRVTTRTDLTELAFADAAFDLVICNHVLEHISNDAAAIREVYRVLVPGGVAILQVPISQELASTFEDAAVVRPQARAALFGQHDHVRIYARDYLCRLSRVGFHVEEFDPLQRFGSKVARYSLIPGEVLFIARKL